jgi:hypothetical protein
MLINKVDIHRPLIVFLALCEDINTPIGLSCYILASNNEFDQLLQKKCDPLHYCDSQSFGKDNLVCSFLSKNPGFLSETIDDDTLAEFHRCEKACSDTNQNFRDEVIPHATQCLLDIARGKISSILGSIPTDLTFGFGPGVSLGVTGVDTGAYSKYSSAQPTVTSHAKSFAAIYLRNSLWGDYLLRGKFSSIEESLLVSDAAKIAFVPKKFNLKRSIAVEPLLNTYFQKGIGNYLKGRLHRKVGIDLKDQTVNQNFARDAELYQVATVDFKSASSLISHGLVLSLIPIDWFLLLNVFRTHWYRLEKRSLATQFHMFSSMGNGYTFELESLLFYALAFASVSVGSQEFHNISVYGDDVILPRSDFETFNRLITDVGLEINKSKSFTDGNFFESCGCDFFKGRNVRAVYLKRNLQENFDIYNIHNLLLGWSSRFERCPLTRTLKSLRDFIHDRDKLYTTGNVGGFKISFEKLKSLGKRYYRSSNDGWEGHFVRILVFSPYQRKNENYEPAILSSLTYPSKGLRSLRDVGHYKRKWIFLRSN